MARSGAGSCAVHGLEDGGALGRMVRQLDEHAARLLVGGRFLVGTEHADQHVRGIERVLVVGRADEAVLAENQRLHRRGGDGVGIGHEGPGDDGLLTEPDGAVGFGVTLGHGIEHTVAWLGRDQLLNGDHYDSCATWKAGGTPGGARPLGTLDGAPSGREYTRYPRPASAR